MALLLASFLVVVPSRTRQANILFAFFLVATAVDISAWFMNDWWGAHPGISAFRPVVAALQMPLFTGFIVHTCFQNARLRAWDALHLAPALLIMGFVMTDTAMPWLGILLELQYVAYIGTAIFALWQFHRRIGLRFAAPSPSLRWLVLMVGASLLAHGFYVGRTLVAPRLPAELAEFLQAVAALLVLFITIWIAFEALLKPERFRGGDKVLASGAKAVDPGSTNQRDQLARFMQEQRPYLDPDLSLERLARRSGIGSKALSTLINQTHGAHFFDFINRLRIDHAKQLLADTDRTVTDILYASGFNSKSTFNVAFRKHSGTTPSAYRSSCRRK